jgi:arylsulfatase A-like enzyme
MTDQHRADCLGCMGHPAIQTPNLNRLASEGVVFENAFCQSPVCMASRATLFTGRYPMTVRVRGMGILPPSENTFPEILRRHGFRTGAFGKVHVTPEQYTLKVLHSDRPILDWKIFARDAGLAPIPDDPVKENYGFETYVGCEDILQGAFHEWLRLRAPGLAAAGQTRPDPLWPDGPADLYVSPYPSEHHPSTFIAQQAEGFIRKQAGGAAPWFAFCSFIAPHHPFAAPADQIARYDGRDIPMPAHKGGVDARFIPAPAATAIGEMDRYPAEVRRRLVLHYLASISLIDDNVGRLLAALEETGQFEDTLILFTADHGEFLGNHGLLRKPSLHYDETLRVPLLMRLPGGSAAGRRERGLVELTDVHPTLLGLLDIPVNDGVQGCDWSAALRAGQPVGRDDIYSDMFDLASLRFGQPTGPYMAVQTLRTEQWKLNVYPTAARPYGQLFDLHNDPEEARNRYADADCREIREDLLWRLNSRVFRNTDPLPFYLTQY